MGGEGIQERLPDGTGAVWKRGLDFSKKGEMPRQREWSRLGRPLAPLTRAEIVYKGRKGKTGPGGLVGPSRLV